MLPNLSHARGMKTALLLSGAVLCTVTAGSVARGHIHALQDFQSNVLPSALELPALERRADVLQQQVEASDLERALRGGASEERLRAFVVPAALSRVRILGYVDAVRAQLQEEGASPDITDVIIGEPVTSDTDLSFAPVTFTVRMKPTGLPTLLSAMELAGSLTVSDVLSDRDIELLLSLTEQENPAAVVSLEQFLDTDLAVYASEPRIVEDQLLKSFTSPAFSTAVQSAVSSDRMQDAKRLLQGRLGETLRANQLWPAPLLKSAGLTLKHLPEGLVELQWRLLTAERTSPGA